MKYGLEYANQFIILPPQAGWYYFGKPGKIPQAIRKKDILRLIELYGGEILPNKRKTIEQSHQQINENSFKILAPEPFLSGGGCVRNKPFC